MIAHTGGTTTTEFMSGLETLWKRKDVTSVDPGGIEAGRRWLSLAAFRMPLQRRASRDIFGAVLRLRERIRRRRA
jgi:hypothetical protein